MYMTVLFCLIGIVSMSKDWLSGNWYLADQDHEQIFVCSADASKCRTIVTVDLRKPRAVAVDPLNGYYLIFLLFSLNVLI